MSTPTYHLSVDLGASSGRVMLGWLDACGLHLEELHRFANGMQPLHGHLCWDYARLFANIVQGMKLCAQKGIHPESIGIDTWGVDFVLLDRDGRLLGDTVAYRDSRTQGVPAQVYRQVPQAELYRRTGCCEQIFNTLFQLYAVARDTPAQLQQASRLLMAPEYLTYLLCGSTLHEFSAVSTTGLLNWDTRTWDWDVVDALGFPRRIFGEIAPSGTFAGMLHPHIAQQVGFTCRVILPVCHDTGAAVLAVPAVQPEFLFLSSGTWSLLGTERATPLRTPAVAAAQFSNEGGYGGNVRLLRNIMGLWIIQQLRENLQAQGQSYSFAQLSDLARQAQDFPGVLDVNDARFLAPQHMLSAVQGWYAERGMRVPQHAGELCVGVFRGLAQCYQQSVQTLQALTASSYPVLHLVGGGSQNTYLNELTADALGMPVQAGPVEATALGNLGAQLLASGEVSSVQALRAIIAQGLSETQ